MADRSIAHAGMRRVLFAAMALAAALAAATPALAGDGDWYPSPSPWGPDDERGAANRLTPESDNAGVEVVSNPDPELAFPVHQFLLAQDGAWEFAFMFAPLRL